MYAERTSCSGLIQIPHIPKAMQTRPNTRQIHCSITTIICGLSAFLFVSSLLPHTLSDTQSAIAAEVSNIFMKTAGAAVVALNRGYDFDRQYSACAVCQPSSVSSTNLSFTYNTLSDTVCI